MANLKPAMTPDEVKKAGVSNIRIAYNDLAASYNRILDRDLLLCPSCGDFIKADTGFYMDKRYVTGRFYMCKKCIMKMVEQRKSEKDEPNETKESVQKVLQTMDLVYDDGFYDQCVKGAYDEAKERNRNSPFATYITSILSLPNWKGKTWKDSDFGASETSYDENETRIIQKTVQSAKKRFGNGFNNEDYMFLENNYQDWCARTQVDSLSQETYVKQICLSLLDIDKDRKAGKDVSTKIKTLDQLMNSANLQPRQNVSNAATDSLTFGQLIEKWENEEPIPEPDPEFKDVNHIGKLIRVFFSGWLCKALGIKNAYSDECEEYISQYEVTTPEVQEEGTSSDIYDKLFGSDGE